MQACAPAVFNVRVAAGAQQKENYKVCSPMDTALASCFIKKVKKKNKFISNKQAYLTLTSYWF